MGDFQAQQYNTKAHVDRPQTPYRKAIPKSSLWERTLNSSSHQKPETVLSSGGRSILFAFLKMQFSIGPLLLLLLLLSRFSCV